MDGRSKVLEVAERGRPFAPGGHFVDYENKRVELSDEQRRRLEQLATVIGPLAAEMASISAQALGRSQGSSMLNSINLVFNNDRVIIGSGSCETISSDGTQICTCTDHVEGICYPCDSSGNPI